MSGKNVLTVVLVALLALAAKSSWDATRAGASAGRAEPSADKAAGARSDANAGQAGKGGKGDKTAPGPAPPCPVADPICQAEADFLGAFKPQVCDETAPPAACKHAAGARGVLAAPTTMILVSVPDPKAVAFAADFDRAIEAIGRGAEGVGYVAQRHWFPWEPGVAEGDAAKPGWLLFRRKRGGLHELLLVLLAREHPSSGIDTAEFEGALDKMREGTEKGASGSGSGKVLLLGPYFSGTATSLDQRLRKWCAASCFCDGRNLVVISGSATVRRTQATVQGLAGVFASSTFHATVLPDDLLQAGMRRFLRDRLDVSPDAVADLTESSTEYGNASRTGLTGLKIPFPMHVGLIADGDKTGKQKAIDEGSERPRLFDTDADKISLQLDNTFAALSRSGIRHVGIIASSTRDKIFLAEQFRQWAPDLRVHMYESSLELADRAHRKALEGVIVASSYPLFPTTQLWSRSGGALQQFPSMAAEGIYNAMLALLAETDARLASQLGGKLLDYGAPFCESTVVGPSAWVSVLIENRLWPLAVYPASMTTAPEGAACGTGTDPFLFLPPASEAAPARPHPHADFSSLAILGAIVVLTLTIGNAVSLFTSKQDAWWRIPLVTYRFIADQTTVAASDLATEARKRDKVRFRRAVWGIWALALIGAVMGKIFYLPSMLSGQVDGPGWQQGLALGLTGSALALTIVAAIATRRSQDGTIRRVGIAVQVVLCVGLMVAMFLVPLESHIRRPDGHAFFFYLRAMDPGVGLTPTIPLFVAAMTIYVGCLLQLSVLRRADALIGDAHEWEPVPDASPPPAPQSFRICADAMRRFAHLASRTLGWVCLAGAGVGFGILFWSPLRLGSFEGRLFDGGCSLCFALVFTMTLASAWRAHALWLNLQEFTRALAIHPAVASLKRLPDSVARRFQSPVPGRVGNDHIQIALDMIRHALGRATPPTIAELRNKLEARWFPLGAHAASASPPDLSKPERLNMEETLEEDFLALKMAGALGLMCDATRTMLFVATGAGMAALFGYAIYPFQPGAALTAAGLLSVGLVALVALRVLLGIERDPVLSLLAKTKAGEITPSLGLFTRLAGYVVVPIGGLIATRLQDQGSIIQMFQDLAKALSR